MSVKKLFKRKNQWVILLIFLNLFGIYPAFTREYRVMTYNIRWDNPDDGINSWDKRKTDVVQFIRKTRPDILGTQEGLKASWILYLKIYLNTR